MSGKTPVLNTLIAFAKIQRRICVVLEQPEEFSAQLRAESTKDVIKTSAQFADEKLRMLISVDDAHLASSQLLEALTDFAVYYVSPTSL